MKRINLAIVIFLSVLMSACNNSEEVPQEAVQTAIMETQQSEDSIQTAVASTLKSLPTSTSAVPAFDYSSWNGYHGPEGFFFNFPPRFNLEVRNNDTARFVVLIAEGDPPNGNSFTIASRPPETGLEEIKAEITSNRDNPVFIDLADYGMIGFTAEGTIPGDGFGGGSVVYEAFFELGDLIILLDCPWNYCDRDEFTLILRSFKLSE